MNSNHTPRFEHQFGSVPLLSVRSLSNTMESDTFVNLNGEEISFQQMKVVDLKNELRHRGLKISGLKSELIERLSASIQSDKFIHIDNAIPSEEAFKPTTVLLVSLPIFSSVLTIVRLLDEVVVSILHWPIKKSSQNDSLFRIVPSKRLGML